MSVPQHHIHRWTRRGMIMLSGIAVISMVIVEIYAQINIKPLMGKGPSIGEFTQPYVNAITQLGLVGIIGLLLTSTYWNRVVSAQQSDEHEIDSRWGLILTSFVLIPTYLIVTYFVSVVSITRWL